MTTVLVTGGAGFIGSCFVRQLLVDPALKAVVLDKLTYAGSLENLAPVRDNPQLWFQEGDVADKTLLDRLFATHAPQWVIHFAAESHVDRSIDAPSAFVHTNVLGTCRLLEACLDYWTALPAADRTSFRFLQVSTDEVFGSLDSQGLFVPESPYAPRSPYAASKAAADHFVRAFYHTYGLPIIITNSSNNYGPYQFPEKLIPLMIRQALAAQSLPVYGDGGQVRDWLHVADHTRGLQEALTNGQPGGTYLFGGDCERSNLEVVEAICRELDLLRPKRDGTSYASQIRFVEDRPGHDRRYAVSTDKAARELRWKPRIEFTVGLRETVAWYVEHPSWVEQVRPAAYDGRRLGLRRG